MVNTALTLEGSRDRLSRLVVRTGSARDVRTIVVWPQSLQPASPVAVLALGASTLMAGRTVITGLDNGGQIGFFEHRLYSVCRLRITNKWPGALSAAGPLASRRLLYGTAASSVPLNGSRHLAEARPAGHLSDSRATNPTANALAGLSVVPFALRGPYRVKGSIEACRRGLGAAVRELSLSFEKLDARRLQTLR